MISIGTKDRKTGEDTVKERTPKGTDNGKILGEILRILRILREFWGKKHAKGIL